MTDSKHVLGIVQGTKLLDALEAAGITPEQASAVIKSPGNAIAKRWVAELSDILLLDWMNNSTDMISVDQAAAIMGDNFHGIEAVERCFFPDNELAIPSERRALAKIQFPLVLIMLCADTHILQPVISLSLLDIWRGPCHELFWSAHRNDPWFGNELQAFARTTPDECWVLLRKDAVPTSTSKSWDDQQKLLEDGEVVPEVSIVAQVMAVHYWETGEQLFPIYMRTKDVTARGYGVVVGLFRDREFIVDCWETNANSGIGLAAARKFS